MSRASAVLAVLSLAGVAAAAPSASAQESFPRILPQPSSEFEYAEPQYYPSLAWMVTQLIPSPEVAFGRARRFDASGAMTSDAETAFGLRWQVTPVAWSFGMNRHLSPWRFFVVDPTARNSGSVELDTMIEYFFGPIDRVLLRPGVHATFPLAHRGEYLSASIGVSTYRYDDVMRVAYDVGAYVLFGVLGVQVTVAPANAPLTTLATFRIRYF